MMLIMRMITGMTMTMTTTMTTRMIRILMLTMLPRLMRLSTVYDTTYYLIGCIMVQYVVIMMLP